MNVYVNAITNAIVGVNLTGKPATYSIYLPDGFDFTKDVANTTYVRQYVSEAMVTSGQFAPTLLNQPLYVTPSGAWTTASTQTIPLLLPTSTVKTYNFLRSPTAFTVSDLLTAKGNAILQDEMYKYVYLEEFLDFTGIDLPASTAINIALKTVTVGAGGTCTTMPIDLPEPSQIFGLYTENDNFTVGLNYTSVNGEGLISDMSFVPLILPFPVTSVYLQFTNVSTTTQNLTSYGLLF